MLGSMCVLKRCGEDPVHWFQCQVQEWGEAMALERATQQPEHITESASTHETPEEHVQREVPAEGNSRMNTCAHGWEAVGENVSDRCRRALWCVVSHLENVVRQQAAIPGIVHQGSEDQHLLAEQLNRRQWLRPSRRREPRDAAGFLSEARVKLGELSVFPEGQYASVAHAYGG